MKSFIFGGERLTLRRNGVIAAAVLMLAAAMMVLAPRAEAANVSEYVTLDGCTLVVADLASDVTVTIGSTEAGGGETVASGSTHNAGGYAPTAQVVVEQKGVPDDITGTIEIPAECYTAGGGDDSEDPADDPTADPVSIDGCVVYVPPVSGVSYFQDQGNDPFLEAGKYNAKHFYPSTTFTARATEGDNEKLGEWTIDVPEECAPTSDDPADDAVIPTKAPDAGR